MIIAIEGPDNAGKSTLVKKIRERVPDARFLSMLGGRMDPEGMRKRTYRALRDAAKPPVLLTERFHPISDLVYRSVFGGDLIFCDVEYIDIIEKAQDHGFTVVYCRPPLGCAQSAIHRQEGDDTLEWTRKVFKELSRLFEKYDQVMFDLAWRKSVTVINYDYTSSISSAIEEALCVALR